MRTCPLVAAVAVLSLLTACGRNEPERAEGGAATGAATGAAVGVVAGPVGVVGGALIGGAAGGLTGAATSPNNVNLGAPPWH
jgi:phage tail tape-measure protein